MTKKQAESLLPIREEVLAVLKKLETFISKGGPMPYKQLNSTSMNLTEALIELDDALHGFADPIAVISRRIFDAENDGKSIALIIDEERFAENN